MKFRSCMTLFGAVPQLEISAEAIGAFYPKGKDPAILAILAGAGASPAECSNPADTLSLLQELNAGVAQPLSARSEPRPPWLGRKWLDPRLGRGVHTGCALDYLRPDQPQHWR
jgi:hypothetical protein